MKLWNKVDSVVLRNFHDYWEDPLVNKFLGDEASKRFEGILILRKNNKPVWLSHPFNYEQAKKHFKDKAVIETYQSMKDIQKILNKHTKKYVGYNPKHQTVTSFKNLSKFLKGKKLIDVEEELRELRETKTPQEVANIAKAAKETRKVLELVKGWLKKGITERELEEKIKMQLEKDGFDCAFCIVAFGKNTAHIHHSADETKLSTGPIMIDMGAKYKGYCADLTEMYYFGEEKEKTGENKEYFDYACAKIKVQECMKRIEKLLKPGTKSTELFKETKTLGEIPHALGHGLGIEVHDVPAGIGSKSSFILKEGMVLAIEPATYNKNFGIRLENNYLITKKGFKRLDSTK